MNLLLLKPDELTDGTALITDRRAEHILKVIKAREGDTLRAGILGGAVGSAAVLKASDGAVTVSFTPEAEPPGSPDISLILALPRPKAFRRILFCAVSCGIKDIHIINSWRVEKSYWESPYIHPDNIADHCAEALSQAKDTIMPAVTFHRFFMGFMEEGLTAIPERRGRYIAHPYAQEGKRPELPAAVAIGPEGGFIEREVQTFERFGFSLFTAGSRTLTTEHFVPYMLGSLIK